MWLFIWFDRQVFAFQPLPISSEVGRYRMFPEVIIIKEAGRMDTPNQTNRIDVLVKFHDSTLPVSNNFVRHVSNEVMLTPVSNDFVRHVSHRILGTFVFHVSYKVVRHVSYEVVRHIWYVSNNFVTHVSNDFVTHVSNMTLCQTFPFCPLVEIYVLNIYHIITLSDETKKQPNYLKRGQILIWCDII